jgi:hypothetical protein
MCAVQCDLDGITRRVKEKEFHCAVIRERTRDITSANDIATRECVCDPKSTHQFDANTTSIQRAK